MKSASPARPCGRPALKICEIEAKSIADLVAFD